MGVIQQQTIKGTFYSFLGVIIGFINLVIISPIVFSTEQIGLTQVMVAISSILAQIGSLGFNNITNRLFPFFRSKSKGHNGYLSLAFLVSGVGYALCLLFMIIHMPAFIENNRGESELLSEYAFYIPVLIGITMLFNLLDNYCKVLFNAVLGTMLRELILRLLFLFLLIAFSLGFIDFRQYMFIYVIIQFIPIIVFVIYLISTGNFIFTRFRNMMTPDMIKQMSSLALFGILAGLSGIAVTNIDKYMVNNYEGLSDAGIYSIAVYFASLILIPARSLGKIAIPVMSEAWKDNNLKQIDEIYYKSSINQLIIGLLIFIGVTANIDNIFRILPPEYSKGGATIIIFGLANLISASAGVSKIILSTSSHYKYMTYLMLILILMVIISNVIFIPIFGITGAAIASLFSMLVYTGLNVLLLWKFYRLWPFRMQHLFMVFLSVFVYLLVSIIPEMNIIIDILVRSVIIVIAFTFVIVNFKISDDAFAFIMRVKEIFIRVFRIDS